VPRDLADFDIPICRTDGDYEKQSTEPTASAREFPPPASALFSEVPCLSALFAGPLNDRTIRDGSLNGIAQFDNASTSLYRSQTQSRAW